MKMFECILQVHMSGYFHITLTPLISVLVSTLFTVNAITYLKWFSQKAVFMGGNTGGVSHNHRLDKMAQPQGLKDLYSEPLTLVSVSL